MSKCHDVPSVVRGPVVASPHMAGIGDQDQETPQVSDIA